MARHIHVTMHHAIHATAMRLPCDCHAHVHDTAWRHTIYDRRRRGGVLPLALWARGCCACLATLVRGDGHAALTCVFCGISGLGWDCLFGTELDGAGDGCYIVVIGFLLEPFWSWFCW